MSQIRNPIVPGFNPDPSCICVNDTYYLVTSSFLYFPGIPVYTSKDLATWTQIGNVITRASQLDYSRCTLRPGTQFAGGIWAPTIRHHDGVFYVVTTCVFTDKDFDDFSRWHNVIFSCTDPQANDWSDPVVFDFPGYDTSLFWDDDGRVYVQGSFYWRIRPEIQQFEIDLKTGKSLSGEPRALWSGMGGIAPEAPHMYKKDGAYYLLIAEGATEFGHRATIARAPTVWGPFTPGDPLLAAASDRALFQTVGHADLFRAARSHNSQWYAVALASRVVRGAWPIGRETCLVRVDWSGAWPVADLAPLDPPTFPAPYADGEVPGWQDVLAGPRHALLHLRNPRPDTYRFTTGGLSMLGARAALTDALGAPTFVGVRQRHLHFACEATLVVPSTSTLEAGLAVYQDHEHHAVAGVRRGRLVFGGVSRRAESLGAGRAEDARVEAREGEMPEGAERVEVSVRGTPERYEMRVAAGGAEVCGAVEARLVNGVFMGVVLALYAVGEGEVRVEGWRYRALGD